MNPILDAPFVIDGERQSVTPAQILRGVSAFEPEAWPGAPLPESIPPVVDETLETDPAPIAPDPRKVEKYLAGVLRAQRVIPMSFAGQYTRGRIACALIDAIWKMGRFRIGNLAVDAVWCWNNLAVGNMAGFYRSVEAAGDYLDALGVSLRETDFNLSATKCTFEATAGLKPGSDDADLVPGPYSATEPRIGAAGIPGSLQPDEASWLVYIPFDSSAYRLGGSLLAQTLEANPPQAPQIDDAPYFIDCYEVVRELVEDGIVLSGATVGEGGLLPALKGMATARTGALLDLSDVRRATGDTRMVDLLFAEVPGVVIQIRDIDFDYIDAELLLQDVAFYPLGHPVMNGGTVRVKASARTGIQNILESLVQMQGGEGED